MRRERFTIISESADLRLDIAVVRAFPELSRAQLKNLEVKASLIDGKALKWSYKVAEGEEIQIQWQEESREDFNHLVASDIPLQIIYEDANSLVVNKPAGMVVHPGIGHNSDTLVNALLSHVDNLEEEFKGDAHRPGLVHRLDKDTSGIVICAKTTQALEFLAEQFRERQTEKYYLAIIKGKLRTPRGIIANSLIRDPKNRQKYIESKNPTGGKQAITHWRLLREWDSTSLVMLRPITGRTHQLRVHMTGEGTPILGDVLYSRTAKLYPRLFLHAWQLTIAIPNEVQEKGERKFLAPIPQDFLDFFKAQEPNFKKEIWFNRLSEGTISP